MIVLILEIIILNISSWLLTKRYFHIRSLSGSIIICFMISFAQVILVEILLGLIGQLYYYNVFTAHVLILLIINSIYPKKDAQETFQKPGINEFLSSRLLLYAASAFLSFFFVKAYINLINPPLSPDSLQFHLAFPATWITNANLNNPFYAFGSRPIVIPGSLETGSLSYYPINAQLFFTWLMLPLRNAFLADLGEAPFYFIGIITIYALLKEYGLNRKIALLSGLIWALIPNIFKQLRTGSLIDVICAVLLLITIYVLVLLKKDFTLKNAILFGMAAGILIGTKIINFTWLIALLPFICFMFYQGIKIRRLNLMKVLGLFSIITIMIVLLGGFMYIKNYLLIKNPMFPVTVKLFGKTIFKGLLDNAGYKTQIAPGNQFNFITVLFKEGLGIPFLTLILPCSFIPLFFFKYLKRNLDSFAEYMLLFITPLAMLISYLCFIDIFWMRYLFPYFTLGLLIAVVFVSKFHWGERYLNTIFFLSVSVSIFELANGKELIISIILLLMIFMGITYFKNRIAAFYNSNLFSKFILAILLIACAALFYCNAKYDKEEFSRYPLSFSKKEAWQADIGTAWKWLNDHTSGSIIAYAGRSEFYPLFGSKLKNHVKYVSINQNEASPYIKPDGLCRQFKDYSAWRNNLSKEEVEFLFAQLPFFDNREEEDATQFTVEDKWALLHPDQFIPVFSNSLVHIYKVAKEKPSK